MLTSDDVVEVDFASILSLDAVIGAVFSVEDTALDVVWVAFSEEYAKPAVSKLTKKHNNNLRFRIKYSTFVMLKKMFLVRVSLKTNCSRTRGVLFSFIIKYESTSPESRSFRSIP